MSDICVIHSSEDGTVVAALVELLKRTWQVWWDHDLTNGDWEKTVRKAIGDAKVVVAVVSPNTEGSDIFRDELALAKRKEKKIFPFVIDEAELPLGFGFIHRTDAYGWNGRNDQHFRSLCDKISSELGSSQIVRPHSLVLRGKTIRLPAFIFSLSSYETRLDPRNGIDLLGLATPPAGLLSAYDAYQWGNSKELSHSIDVVRESSTVLVLDSGNYEAFRKEDRFDQKTNKTGWKREEFVETAARVSPDLSFSFDYPDPSGRAGDIANDIIARTRSDERDIHGRDFPICPIVHLPLKSKMPIPQLASSIIRQVAESLNPVMIAVPERELGDGIVERARTVREIRRSLNTLDKYYPLHILGTGNPLSMLILSAVGADSFDGLEWCRTAADWDTWRLHHFQHFDFFSRNDLGRLPVGLRKLAENKKVPFSIKAACYNMAAFQHWVKEIQDRTGTTALGELMELHIPGIGERLYQELNNDPTE